LGVFFISKLWDEKDERIADTFFKSFESFEDVKILLEEIKSLKRKTVAQGLQ